MSVHAEQFFNFSHPQKLRPLFVLQERFVIAGRRSAVSGVTIFRH
jgi:hypothetical protein